MGVVVAVRSGMQYVYVVPQAVGGTCICTLLVVADKVLAGHVGRLLQSEYVQD